MVNPRKHTKYPEFIGMKELVWDKLNQIGRTIDQIRDSEKESIQDSKKYADLKNSVIWHTKSEIDEFVKNGLNLKLEDYDYKTGNALYKQVANEIKELRDEGILQDWRSPKSKNRTGVWSLDKTKLEEHAKNLLKRERKNEQFHARGEVCSVYVRYKQGLFKKSLVNEYGKCALCRFKIPEYMIGAHIVPYAIMKSEDPRNAMNPSNGLLLCKFCDVAFEWGTIRIESDRGITISECLTDDKSTLAKTWLAQIPEELYVKPDAKYPPDPEYLKWKIDLLKIK